ncbi:hypothetical protein I4U23_012469 [Adineta vaga]|nr:hypothetical protein I4U23_012469 [Adineta vaga]
MSKITFITVCLLVITHNILADSDPHQEITFNNKFPSSENSFGTKQEKLDRGHGFHIDPTPGPIKLISQPRFNNFNKKPNKCPKRGCPKGRRCTACGPVISCVPIAAVC